MNEFRVRKSIFPKSVSTPQGYALQMIEHLEEVEEGLKALREMDECGCGLTTFWTIEHKDGRIARIAPPDSSTCEYWHKVRLYGSNHIKQITDK